MPASVLTLSRCCGNSTHSARFRRCGVVLLSLGDACVGVSTCVFPLKIQPFCVRLVLLVLCYARVAPNVSLLGMVCSAILQPARMVLGLLVWRCNVCDMHVSVMAMVCLSARQY